MKEKYIIVNFEESISFVVMCKSHLQHEPYSTLLQGLSKRGEKKIKTIKEPLYTYIAGRKVKINNK